MVEQGIQSPCLFAPPRRGGGGKHYRQVHHVMVYLCTPLYTPITLSPTVRYNGPYVPPYVQGMRVVLGSPGWGMSRRGWWPPEV